MRGEPRTAASLLMLASLAACAAQTPQPPAPAPEAAAERPPADAPSARVPDARALELEQRNARLELQLLEKEAQLDEMRLRLDDARREVVRAMGKLQSQATRAEAASGMAEAEIALRSLRTAGGAQGAADVSQLLKLSTVEFDRQNYAGALYLANQAKGAALAARGQVGGAEVTGGRRPGEVSFALPLRLQTAGRANVRDGPGGNFSVLYTLATGVAVTAHAYVDEWVRVTDESGRGGWIYQPLIRRPP
jgi:Bacterial SH3 domain